MTATNAASPNSTIVIAAELRSPRIAVWFLCGAPGVGLRQRRFANL